MPFWNFIFFVILLVVFSDAGSDGFDNDFYSLLGVNRRSSIKEIKDAYKNEARKWHPEINPSEDASYRFYLINEAYRTLSNPEKRSLYEVFGKGSNDIDIFIKDEDGLQGDGFHLVTSQFVQSTSSDLWTISSKYYDKIVKPESFRYPFVMFVNSIRCEHCKVMVDDWISWCHELSHEGVKCGQIKIEEERWLLRRLHAPNIIESAMVGILEGRPLWNVNISSNLQELRHFVTSLFSGDFLPELDSDGYLRFLKTCSEQKNHVTLMLFTNSLAPPLAYYTSIFYARSHISGAFVHTRNPSSKLLLDKYNISHEKPTLLVFKEDLSNPSFKLSMKVFKKNHFDTIITKHHLLKTPRISCPVMFDLICPPDTPKAKKKLCVILLTSKDEKFESHLESFKRFSEEYIYSDRVKFAYVLEERQRNFVQLVTWGKDFYNSTSNTLKLFIAWHKDSKTLNYEFLEDGWHAHGSNLQRSRRKLVQLIEWLLNSPSTLSNIVELKKEIANEHQKSLWKRILIRLREWCDGSIDFFLGVDNATYVTAIQSLIFVVAIGFGFRYLALREVRMIDGPRHPTWIFPPQNAVPEKPVIYIHMLCPENYRSLLLDSPPSVRLILLLVDTSSKDRLIKYFGAFLQPYARSKAFKFAFVNLQEYFQWYVELLDLTMRQSDHYQLLKRSFGSINVKNCLGTVLAINGMKKYYFMYHISSFKDFPKSFQKERLSDTESDEGEVTDVAREEFQIGFSQKSGLLKRRNKEGSMEIRGQASNHRPSRGIEKLFEFDLLRGLGIWLEKLCQGKLKKFRITQWPKNMTSTLD